jgi:hypothetical protein
MCDMTPNSAAPNRAMRKNTFFGWISIKQMNELA